MKIARAVNGHYNNDLSRSEWEEIIVKEGNVKKKIFMSNLVIENLSFLSPRENERVKVAWKSS